jgi:hypothetical protein
MHREIIQGHKEGNVIQQPIESSKHNEQIKSLFELRATYYNGLVYKNQCKKLNQFLTVCKGHHNIG